MSVTVVPRTVHRLVVDIAATGRLLDQKLAALLSGLGVAVPDGLA